MEPDQNPYRLPREVIPLRYQLRLEPDLTNFTFSGSEQIEIEITEPVTEIVLNAIELDLQSAEIKHSSQQTNLEISYQEETQRVILASPGLLPVGPAILDIKFTGVLNDQLHGFYRSTFTDINGQKRVLATTQFESTDARRAFPCWDEPDFKAVFSVTLVVDPTLFAVSNARETHRETLADGRVAINYADTIKMSTYLVAFVIGPLEATDPVDAAGTPLRVIVPLGKLGQSDYALECGKFSLQYLQDYYRIPYPGDKLDMVAIPDFAFGAMENLGCVTYREAALLLDPQVATTNEQIRVLDVVAHELAHMWFGDLVTMRWWNGIWLNEAFASFMEMKAAQAMRPEWKRWLQFGAIDRPWAFRVDSLANTRPVEFEVHSPEEADEMFDALTYGKGSAVLRMIEQFIGEEIFRSGVGDYLRTHQYANTDTEDLWQGLAGSSPYRVGEIMDTWIRQGGFPSIEVQSEGKQLSLIQSRYLTIPNPKDETRWKIPLQLRGEIDGKPFQLRQVFDQPELSLQLDGTPDWVIANAGGHGYYRVSYSSELAAGLQKVLPNLADLERFCLVDDAWAFVDNGQQGVDDYLRFVESFSSEPEAWVWQSILEALGNVHHHLVADEFLPRFGQLVSWLIKERLEVLGWEPRSGESDRTRLLRGMLWKARSVLVEDSGTIGDLDQLYQQWLAKPTSVDPDMAQAAISSAATHGNLDRFGQMMSAYQSTTDPQDQMRFLRAITLFDQTETIDAILSAVDSGEIRNQDSSWVIAGLFGGRNKGPYAWKQVRSNWEKLLEKMPPVTIRRMVDGLPNLSGPQVSHEVLSFLKNTPIPSSEKAASQAQERLRANIALRESQTERLESFLASL